MNGTEAALRRASLGATFVAGLLLIAAAAYVTVEVLARKLFSVSLFGANELSSYALAVSAAWSFSFALLQRGHIRIDFLYRFLRPRAAAFVDLAALASLIGFAVILLFHASGVLDFAVRHATRSNTPLGTPMWIPLGLWFAGLAMFALTAMYLAGRAIAALASGDLAEARRLAGPPDVDEGAGEVAAEIGARAGRALAQDRLS